MEYSKVIKVKYGNTLRRFNAFIDENGKMDLDINGLRAKVITLFNLVPDADLILTYIDEDGDVVTLVDDEDLHDAMRQRLKFLRINVLLNTEKGGRSNTWSSGSSTPMRSPFNLHPFLDGNAGFAEVTKSVPEPLREAFLKLSTDFTSKAASSAPVLSEVLACLSKMGESYLNSASPSEVGEDSSTTKNRPSDKPIDPLVTEYTKPSQADSRQELLRTDEFKDSTSKSNEVRTTGPVSRGVGTSITPAATFVDLNFPSSPDISELPYFPDISKISIFPVVTETGDVSIKAGITSNVPVTDNKETNKESGVAPVASNDLAVDMTKETKKESECIACSDCPDDGRKGTKKGSVGYQGEMFAGCVASTCNAGYPRPYNPDPSHFTFFDGGINKKISNHSAPNFGNPFSDCPFTGMPSVNNSGLSSAHHRSPLFKRNYKDAVGGTFHKGIQCDGCGVHPITGPRFKSKIKEDYDLCSICFSEMGNEADYIRIDWPARQHPWSFNASHDPMQQPEVHTSAQPYPSRGCGGKIWQPNLDSRFILDVNVIDGTVMAPSTPFTKTWRMRNNGNAVWPRGTRLVWIGGDRFSEKDLVEICGNCVPIGGELEISVDFTAPEVPGRFISYWRMATPSGQRFGQRVWVLIQVDGSLKDLLGDSMPVINLNLPPTSGGSKSPQIIDVNVEPVVDGDLVEVNEPAKSIVKEHAKKDQEVNYPINDNLIATNAVPGPVSPENNSSVSYPMIDFSDVAPISGSDQVALDQAALEELCKKDGVEEALLKALDEMGFKCDEFNKEILRLHEYDLEETVNHLCGVGEWDPILEELKEMGFYDIELNKKLLRKNNGSIKRVVMDLIAVEKY